MLHRVACVEEDADTRYVLSCVLKDIGGFDACIFDNCVEALSKLPAFRPQFILLDAQAHRGMSGVDLCASLSGDPHLGHVPRAFLSTHLLRHEVSRLERLAPVIAKPFDPMSLAERIRAIHEGMPRHGADALAVAA